LRHGAGSLLGILPGGGACWLVRRLFPGEEGIKHSAEFGKGAIEGVAAPDRPTTPARRHLSSRCSRSASSNPVMALMIGAMIIQSIGGPNVMVSNRSCSGGVIASGGSATCSCWS
jgi:TctA family transporter